MKCTVIRCDEPMISAFLSTNPKVLSKHVVPKEIPEIVFFYDTPEDDAAAKDRALIEQNAQMERLQDLAQDILVDKKYSSLKNNTQKEIYLSVRYNLAKSDAVIVIEMLKPEMLAAIGGE